MVLIEGEEEVGSANLDNFIRATRTCSRPMRGIRIADVRSRHSVDLLRPARAELFPDRPPRQQVGFDSGSFGGAVANLAMVLAQVLADEGQGRPREDRRLTTMVPLVMKSARSGRGCRSTRSIRPISCAEAIRRNWLHHARVRGRASTFEVIGCPASPATAPRQCCWPWRWPKSACLVPNQIREDRRC